jgi:hypothetical protein
LFLRNTFRAKIFLRDSRMLREKEKEVSKTQKKTTTNKSQNQKKELTKEQKTERIRKRLSDRAYLGRNVSQEKLTKRLGVC